MSMALQENIKVKCSKCGAENEIKREEFKEDIERNEKERGLEKIHKYTWEGNCHNCGNEIKIEINGREYPESVYKSEKHNIEGAEFIEEPKLGIVHKR